MNIKLFITIGVLCSLSVNAATPDMLVEFNSTILANTCTISSQSQNMSVDLGSYKHWEVTETKNRRVKNFSILLEGCGSSVSYVKMYFTGSAPYNPILLQSQEMYNRNIGIEVNHLPAGVPIYFTGGASYIEVVLQPSVINEVKFSAIVRPTFNNKAVIPGKINVVMNYTLEYQ